MKKIIYFFALTFFANFAEVSAQKAPANGRYVFHCDALGGNKALNVKGTYLGGQNVSGTYYDYYLEKTDALNHKFKAVRIRNNKFTSMAVHTINEAALAINNLTVKANTGEGKDKLPFVVTLKNLKNDAEKDRIQHKTYTAHAGDYNKTEYGVETTAGSESVDVFFPTKAQAEAFIADLKTLAK